MNDLIEFDISQYLNSNEIIAEYLSQVLLDGDMKELITAIGNVAKAKGINKIAKDTGINKDNIYNIFKVDAEPQFYTVMKILNSFNLKLSIHN
jgi:probable addiction module antidote protein